MAEDKMVWAASFSVKATIGSMAGDISISDMTTILDQKVREGFKFVASNAYHADADALRVFVLMSKV